jgi:hypothetical protein
VFRLTVCRRSLRELVTPFDSTVRSHSFAVDCRAWQNRIHELLKEKTVARWSAPLARSQFVGLAVIAVSIGTSSQDAPAQRTALDQAPKSLPSATPAEAPEKAPATTKGATAPQTLERILANWKARAERTRTLYFCWEGRLFAGKAARDRRHGKPSSEQAERSSQVALWAERPYRFRLDVAHFTGPVPKATALVARIHSVRNGLSELVESSGRPPGLPTATFSKRRGGNPLETYDAALTLAFRPQDAIILLSPSRKFRVVNENALKDGRHCVQMQIVSDNGAFSENCWVDPARDDVVVAYESWRQLNERHEVNSVASIEYQHHPVHGWVPARWTVGNGTFGENTVTKYAINERFPEDTFSLKVSPATRVFDQRTAERYRVAADGGKSEVVQIDSLKSLQIQRVLQSTSDFSIARQPLKDAIDFIAARYQIPIVVYKADFEAVGFLTVAVGPIPPGMKIAELLKTLLAKCPKPVGFRIEDEVLKMSPKFTEQGALQIRPAPVLPANASAKERKIQAALEMPVDFNIEPQSLKDALDFLGARYHIRIESDPLMDSLIEVKGNFPGIKLRSLLSILLEQCPGQPLGFKIERDALKIAPVTDKPEPGAARP